LLLTSATIFLYQEKMKLNSTQISERILMVMQNLNCSQKEFARRLQITQPAVSKYLNGRIPPANVLLKLAKITNTSIEWILTGQHESSPKPAYIAEPMADYQLHSRLLDKIQSLPEPIKIQIINLIDQIDKIVKK
jgi:transcriptional regulator with XRE-family HTH domain